MKNEWSINVSFCWFYSSLAVQAPGIGSWLNLQTIVFCYSFSSHLEFIDVTSNSLGSSFLPRSEMLIRKELKLDQEFGESL